jgi:hypothetical protein
MISLERLTYLITPSPMHRTLRTIMPISRKLHVLIGILITILQETILKNCSINDEKKVHNETAFQPHYQNS